MMKRSIVVTYKSGSTISIDVPSMYYSEKYKKYPEKRLHKVFLHEYNKFVRAMNKGQEVVNVGKYLKFSNTSICGKDVLGIDVKVIEDVVDGDSTNNNKDIYVPGVHDVVYLDISKTQLEDLIKKLNDTELIDNLDKLCKKLVAYFNKANVEFSIKGGKKTTTTSSGGRKKKSTNVVDVVDSVEETNTTIDSVTNK